MVWITTVDLDIAYSCANIRGDVEKIIANSIFESLLEKRGFLTKIDYREQEPGIVFYDDKDLILCCFRVLDYETRYPDWFLNLNLNIANRISIRTWNFENSPVQLRKIIDINNKESNWMILYPPDEARRYLRYQQAFTSRPIVEDAVLPGGWVLSLTL